LENSYTGSPIFTDLYQITMAYGYWKTGKGEEQAVFNLYFRKNPFQGGFVLACGLESVIQHLERFRFSEEELAYLSQLKGADGEALFVREFLTYLRELRFSCDIDAIPEGTLVFPDEPLLRVIGPIIQCQLLETALLNVVNFQSLIATKAARMRLAAPNDSLLEFGLRRAQGPDGGIMASRAAFIGGFDGTSNVFAGMKYGIPVKGTHAHSWVMSFPTERESFDAYAENVPNNVILLVDTYDTVAGVKNAIETGKMLRAKGHKLLGIRLDSGDLAYLSIESRKLLDEAGFEDTAIVASNDLDEHIIKSLKEQGAEIDTWGVGTKLVTGHDQPALGGVYKLAAIRQSDGRWEYKLKLSEQSFKVSTPGILQVRRFKKDGVFAGDMIYNQEFELDETVRMVNPYDFTKQRSYGAEYSHEDLLVPVYRSGELVYQAPEIQEIKSRVADQLSSLYEGTLRFSNPHTYKIGLEQALFELKTSLILEKRKG
jgi:nicotinate phosphoribosyltransferase